MGLDAYFYRIKKTQKTENRLEFEDVYKAIVENDCLFDSFVRLNEWAFQNDKTFVDALYDAIGSFLSSECFEGTQKNEVLYFRRFYYLLSYFEYGDNEYARDMKVTQEQCEDLRKKAQDCLNEIDAYLKKNRVGIGVHDGDGMLMCIEDAPPFSKKEEKAFNMIGEIRGRYFPCSWDDTMNLQKIYDLYKGMDDIIKTTDWDTQDIVFNADW